MKEYQITYLDISFTYFAIITILDYEAIMANILKLIRFSDVFCNNKRRVLIDALLYSGLNEYRYIDMKLNSDGRLALNDYKYVTVSDDLKRKTNQIVNQYPTNLYNSILLKQQADEISKAM